MVKVELGKRDFIWIGFIVILACVGFGYAYGGSSPSIAGHSSGEIVEADPTVPANIKDGVSWSEISGIPAGFTDGVDNVGVAGQLVYVANEWCEAGGAITTKSTCQAKLCPAGDDDTNWKGYDCSGNCLYMRTSICTNVVAGRLVAA